MVVLVGLMGSMSGLLIGDCTAVIAPALEFIIRDFRLDALLIGAVPGIVMFLVVSAMRSTPDARRASSRCRSAAIPRGSDRT